MEPNLCCMWKKTASGCCSTNRGNLKMYSSSAENVKSLSPSVSEEKKRRNGGFFYKKQQSLSPFHCSCFPLVVFIFTGQPGCEGRLQGFGDRAAAQERMRSLTGSLALSRWPKDPKSCCCYDWTTHRIQDSRDESVRSGAWTRAIEDMQFRALDKLGRGKAEILTLHLFVCRLKWAANHKHCRLPITWHVNWELHRIFILTMSLKWY